MLSLLYIVTLILLAPVISGTGALTPIIVLSPKANQEFSPGQNVFFEYALIDSSVQQLDIFLDSFGTVNNEVLLKYISFDTANSDGIYTLNGRTYKKYSTDCSIPTDLSTENEAYQITFQTAVGDVLIPIKMNQPATTSSIIAGITTTTNSENSLISPTSTSLAFTTKVLATTTITIDMISSVIPATSKANSNINTTTTITISPIMTTVNASRTTTVPISTVFSSTTASLVSNSNMSMMSTSSTSSIPLTAVVTTTADPQNSSYSFSTSTAFFYSSFINTSISKTQISSYTISQTSIEPSAITTTPSTATSIITTGTLSATYTPTPPNPDSLVLRSAATNSVKADFSIVTVTLIALLLFRLLLTQ